MNAIYFKGNWLRKFDAALTKTEPFYLGSNDKTINTQMMHIDGDYRTGDIQSLDARAVELPYVVRDYFSARSFYGFTCPFDL